VARKPKLPETMRAAAIERFGGPEVLRLRTPNGVEPEPKRRKGLKVTTYDAVAGVGEFERLNRAVSAAKLEVPSAAAFPLAEAWKAHKRLERGHVLGRVVLRVR
jgi:NADPH2:quinone reductase